MQHRRLGKEGPVVSALGLGGWPLGGRMGRVSDEEAIAIIRAAIDSGVTLIDTAQGYLASEARIGRALKDGYRKRCFLATKVSGNYTRANIKRAIAESLRALEVEYVDLYQIHSWDPACNVEEAMEAMAGLQTEGKTRFIGVSNYNARQMERALRAARFQSNQPVYNLFERGIEREDLAFCEREGIGVLAHSPLAKGLLSGKYGAHHRFSSNDERSSNALFQGEWLKRYIAAEDRLKEIANAKGLTLAQLAISWLLRKSAVTCVLFGAKSLAQVEENARAADVRFSDDELHSIEKALANRAMS